MSNLNIGYKVKVISMDERIKTIKFGRVAVIKDHFIVLQFKNYKESFKKTDILSKGWVDMQLWNGREWIKVDKEVMK